LQRTNAFIVENSPGLWELADGCARLWNEVNFERRQAYIHYRKFPWYPKHLYEKYARLIGSATAQQVINKNNEAWRSLLKLKRLDKHGKLPTHIKKVSMPRYWKRNGRRELRVIVRNDCYRLERGFLHLPKGLTLRYKGRLRWKGRQGRLEIIYDDVDRVWRGFMTDKVEEPPRRGGDKPLYIDLGVINLATVWFEGLRRPIAFSGRSILADWWYWTKKIAEEQRRLARVNGAKTSRRLRRLFRIRKRRFRHAVNAMVKAIIEDVAQLGVSKIILGDLRGIRENNHKNGKANSIIHNFWSHAYIIQRFREKAEEYGIEVVGVDEHKTSSVCPSCGSDRTVKRGRLFKCLSCGIEAHRDAVGVLNIGLAQGAKLPTGAVNGLMAEPLLLRWNGMRWKPKRAMNTRPMKACLKHEAQGQKRRVHDELHHRHFCP
jgi:putative transposase